MAFLLQLQMVQMFFCCCWMLTIESQDCHHRLLGSNGHSHWLSTPPDIATLSETQEQQKVMVSSQKTRNLTLSGGWQWQESENIGANLSCSTASNTSMVFCCDRLAILVIHNLDRVDALIINNCDFSYSMVDPIIPAIPSIPSPWSN